jgi:chromosome segregation ATPase
MAAKDERLLMINEGRNARKRNEQDREDMIKQCQDAMSALQTNHRGLQDRLSRREVDLEEKREQLAVAKAKLARQEEANTDEGRAVERLQCRLEESESKAAKVKATRDDYYHQLQQQRKSHSAAVQAQQFALKECHANQAHIIRAQEKMERQLHDQSVELDRKRQRVADLVQEAEHKMHLHSVEKKALEHNAHLYSVEKKALEHQLKEHVSELETTADALRASEAKVENTTAECAAALEELSELRQAHEELRGCCDSNKREIDRLSEIDKRQAGAFGLLEQEYESLQVLLDESLMNIEKTRSELEGAQARGFNLEAQLESSRNRCADAEERLEAVETQGVELEAKGVELEATLKERDRQIATVEVQLVIHRARCEDLQGEKACYMRTNAALEQEVAAAEGRVVAVRAEKMDIERELEKAYVEKARVEGKVEKVVGEMEGLKAELETARGERAELEGKVHAVGEAKAEVEATLDQVKETLAAVETALGGLQEAHLSLREEHETTMAQGQQASKQLQAEHEEEVGKLRSEYSLIKSKCDLLQTKKEAEEKRMAAANEKKETEGIEKDNELQLMKATLKEAELTLQGEAQSAGELRACRVTLATKDQELQRKDHELQRMRAVQQQVQLGMEEVEKRHQEREAEMEVLNRDNGTLARDCDRLQGRERELMQLLSSDNHARATNAADIQSEANQDLVKECERLRCELEVSAARLQCEAGASGSQMELAKALEGEVEMKAIELRGSQQELVQSGEVLDATQQLVHRLEMEAEEQSAALRECQDARSELSSAQAELEIMLRRAEEERDVQAQACAAAEGQIHHYKHELARNEQELQVHADAWGDELKRRKAELGECKAELSECQRESRAELAKSKRELQQCHEELAVCVKRREEDDAQLISLRMQMAKSNDENARLAAEAIARARGVENLDAELSGLKGKLAEAVLASAPPLTPSPGGSSTDARDGTYTSPAISPVRASQCSPYSASSEDDSITLLEKLQSHSVLLQQQLNQVISTLSSTKLELEQARSDASASEMALKEARAEYVHQISEVSQELLSAQASSVSSIRSKTARGTTEAWAEDAQQICTCSRGTTCSACNRDRALVQLVHKEAEIIKLRSCLRSVRAELQKSVTHTGSLQRITKSSVARCLLLKRRLVRSNELLVEMQTTAEVAGTVMGVSTDKMALTERVVKVTTELRSTKEELRRVLQLLERSEDVRKSLQHQHQQGKCSDSQIGDQGASTQQQHQHHHHHQQQQQQLQPSLKWQGGRGMRVVVRVKPTSALQSRGSYQGRLATDIGMFRCMELGAEGQQAGPQQLVVTGGPNGGTKKTWKFDFDRIFIPARRGVQYAVERYEEIYTEEVAELVDAAAGGAKVCIFASGQSCSGKTATLVQGCTTATTGGAYHSLHGASSHGASSRGAHHGAGVVSTEDGLGACQNRSEAGLIPRAVRQLFDSINTATDTVSYQLLEIQCEEVHDMLSALADESKSGHHSGVGLDHGLHGIALEQEVDLSSCSRVRIDGHGPNSAVVGARAVVADSAQKIIDTVGMALVLQRRRRQQQRQLHRSSRSHVVLSIRIEKARGPGARSNSPPPVGMLHLIDLAVSSDE